MGKKEISKLLQEDKGWISVDERMPMSGIIVIIRIYNPHYIYHEDKETIYHAEDIKLAQILSDYNDPENKDKMRWSIIPPYPLYDYSPLSKMDQLLDGSIVTHWAEASNKDIEAWRSRFNISDGYLSLRVETDDDHRQLMYRALMYSLGIVGNAYMKEKSDELLAFHIILQDLLNSMDKRIYIKDGKEISLWDKEVSLEEQKKRPDDVSSELQEILNSTKHMLDEGSNNITEDKLLAAVKILSSNLLKKSKDPHQYCITDSIKYEIKNLLSSLSIDPSKADAILEEE